MSQLPSQGVGGSPGRVWGLGGSLGSRGVTPTAGDDDREGGGRRRLGDLPGATGAALVTPRLGGHPWVPRPPQPQLGPVRGGQLPGPWCSLPWGGGGGVERPVRTWDPQPGTPPTPTPGTPAPHLAPRWVPRLLRRGGWPHCGGPAAPRGGRRGGAPAPAAPRSGGGRPAGGCPRPRWGHPRPPAGASCREPGRLRKRGGGVCPQHPPPPEPPEQVLTARATPCARRGRG